MRRPLPLKVGALPFPPGCSDAPAGPQTPGSPVPDATLPVVRPSPGPFLEGLS